jgi:hypothetical protein
VQNALEIVFVEHIDEVLDIAFVKDDENFGATVEPNMPISPQSVN